MKCAFPSRIILCIKELSVILDTFVIHVPRAKANSDRLIVLTGYFTMLSAFLGVSQSFAQHASADFTHDLSLSYKGLKIL